MDKKYEEYWADGEPGGHAEADPGVSAVKAAAATARDTEAKEFSDAFTSFANQDESSGNGAPAAETHVPEASDGPTGEGSTVAAPEEKKPEPVKPKAFKEAFSEARKSGQKVFDWNGKKYTTDLAKPKAAPAVAAPAAAPVAKASEPTLDADGFPNALKGKASLASSMKGVKSTGMGNLKQ